MKYLYEEAHVSFLENSRNKYIKRPEILVREALTMIKEGAFKTQVNSARLIGKDKDPDSYTALKNKIPTWTPSANFHRTKEKKNIKNLTGFYYLDIDKNKVDPERLKQFDFVYAFWTSVSNLGYGIIVKCTNLTTQNYLKVWDEFDKIFQNENLFLDPLAKGYSRQCVFSYDPNIYINPDATIFDCGYVSVKKKPQTLEIQLTKEEKLAMMFDEIPWLQDSRRIKLKKVLDDYEGKDFIFKREGIDTRNVFINKVINLGCRNVTLSSIVKGIIYNNPEVDFPRLLKYMLNVNQNHCIPALPEDEVYNICSTIFNQKVSGELVIDTKKKYTFFSPDSLLTVKEKLSIGAKNAAIVRKEKRLSELQFIYNELKLNYPKVTQQLLADNSGVSIETVKRYWKNLEL